VATSIIAEQNEPDKLLAVIITAAAMISILLRPLQALSFPVGARTWCYKVVA
jgi:hypothetical protein